MKMKILIVGNSSHDNDAEARAYYKKYTDFFDHSTVDFTKADIGAEACVIEDLLISVGDNEFVIYDTFNKSDVREYSAIFFRGDRLKKYIDVIATINEYARTYNIKVINDYSGVRSPSKLLQAVKFHTLGIPVARTIYVSKALLDLGVTAEWKFPCIMKSTHGSHGNDNYVVESMEGVRERQLDQPTKHFVLQRFVPNNGDYRILVIGDEVLVIGRKAVGNSHLNNTSQGGDAFILDPSELPDGVIDNTMKIMNYYKMSIAGVDVLVDKNTSHYSFLEVNSQPQLMSGAFVDEKSKMVGALLGKLEEY